MQIKDGIFELGSNWINLIYTFELKRFEMNLNWIIKLLCKNKIYVKHGKMSQVNWIYVSL